MRVIHRGFLMVFTVAFVNCFATPAVRGASAKCCVWKVTSGRQTLYIAGSVHALRKADYPLPAAYDQAFNASAELVFETDPYATSSAWEKKLDHAAQLPKNTTLKDKLDPRTWAYIQQVLARVKGSADPEKKIAHLRPWALSWMLESPGGLTGLSSSYGVDSYLQDKGRKAGKRLSGLVNLDQHIAVFGGMSDADNEAFLLLQFINLDAASAEYIRTLNAWKRGDTATVDLAIRADYGAAPGLYRRIIADRNLTWIPKIQSFLRPGGRTRMVIVGAAHTSGSEGLPALLQAKGYQVEQL